MKIFNSLGLLFVLVSTPAFSQSVFDFKGDAGNPIIQKLGVGTDKPLRMGWLVAPDKLVTDVNASEVTAYSSSNKVLVAKLIGPLSKEDAAAIRKKSCVACEPTVDYYQYQLDGAVAKDGERVLITSAFPDVKVGFDKIKMTNFLIKRAAGLLEAEKGSLHKSLYLRTKDGKFTYSFHAFYDPKSKALKRYGMLLHKRGVLLAQEAKVFELSNNGTPNYKDPLEKVFSPVNLLYTSVLPCPLILLDTSAGESRGLSLVTFDMDGVKSEVKVSESVVNCCK